MRSAARALAVLALLAAAGCVSEPEPVSAPTPPGPCEKSREQPPDGSQELREQADLDGDGRADEVVSWIRGGERVVQAWLATGDNADPQALFSGKLLGTVDLDGDGREEVFAQTGEATGAAYRLDGCELVPVTIAGTDREWEYAVGPGAALLCRQNGIIEEAVTTGAETVRRAWTLTGGAVTGADPLGSGPVTTPGIICT